MGELTNRLRRLALALYLPLAAVLAAACAADESTTRAPLSQQTVGPDTGATAVISQPVQPTLEVGPDVGQRAPAFTLTTAEGEVLTLDSFQGRPVVLYFFATW